MIWSVVLAEMFWRRDVPLRILRRQPPRASSTPLATLVFVAGVQDIDDVLQGLGVDASIPIGSAFTWLYRPMIKDAF